MSPHSPLSVLIVEDDPLVALDEAQIVESFGDAVVGIADESVGAFRLADQGASLALLDVNLSDGRTGPAICERLVGAYRIPVVFVTGNPELLPIDFAGALGCIVKPYAASTLGETLAFIRRCAEGHCPERKPYSLVTPPKPSH